MRVTIPGTAAHGERIKERWRRCLQSNPESLCARRLPGGRPASGPPASSLSESESGEQQHPDSNAER
jgi:hypothetical protein